MLQSRERTDSYAAIGGRFVQQFHFLCISSGNPDILARDLNARVYRDSVCGLFGKNLEDARICLAFVSGQAWYVAVQAGLPELAADNILECYATASRRATRVDQVVEAFARGMVSFAQEMALLRQPRVENERIQQTIRYISSHICEPLTVAQVAQAMNFTPSYLSREFRESTGMTVVAFIQSEKVRSAKVLLRDQSLSVTQVMERLGYVSQSHFTKVFRECTGMTPNRYRTMVKSQSREYPLPTAGDWAWKRRLESYQELEVYWATTGEELLQYMLSCVRRGNVQGLEEELSRPAFQPELYALFRGDVTIAMESLLCTWGQLQHAAISSGVDREEAVKIFSDCLSRLYGCVSVNEALDLNREYTLRIAGAVAQLE